MGIDRRLDPRDKTSGRFRLPLLVAVTLARSRAGDRRNRRQCGADCFFHIQRYRHCSERLIGRQRHGQRGFPVLDGDIRGRGPA